MGARPRTSRRVQEMTGRRKRRIRVSAERHCHPDHRTRDARQLHRSHEGRDPSNPPGGDPRRRDARHETGPLGGRLVLEGCFRFFRRGRFISWSSMQVGNRTAPSAHRHTNHSLRQTDNGIFSRMLRRRSRRSTRSPTTGCGLPQISDAFHSREHLRPGRRPPVPWRHSRGARPHADGAGSKGPRGVAAANHGGDPRRQLRQRDHRHCRTACSIK